jgi:hypothetical protein
MSLLNASVTDVHVYCDNVALVEKIITLPLNVFLFEDNNDSKAYQAKLLRKYCVYEYTVYVTSFVFLF